MSVAQDEATLRVIEHYAQQTGHAPSVRDIAVILGLSVSRTHTVLYGLREQGRVSWTPGMSRTLVVTEPVA